MKVEKGWLFFLTAAFSASFLAISLPMACSSYGLFYDLFCWWFPAAR
jgi:hypothetical protein